MPIEVTDFNPLVLLGVMDPRYPATVEDITERSGKSGSFIKEALTTLMREGKVVSKEIGGMVFYKNVSSGGGI